MFVRWLVVDAFGNRWRGRRRPRRGFEDELDELDGESAGSESGADRRGVNEAALEGNVISDEDPFGCCKPVNRVERGTMRMSTRADPGGGRRTRGGPLD